MSEGVDLIANRHRIARWMRGLWAEDVEAKPDQLVLRHVSVSDRQVDVASFVIGDKPPEDHDGLIGRIEEALENDADGLGGVQKYVLLALKEGRALSRLPMRVAGNGDEGGNLESLESEPANSKGLLAQLMRHNEVQSRMFAMSMGQVISTMQRTIARLQETVEVADERRLAAVDVAEDLLTRGHERAALTQMVDDNRAAKNALFESVKAAMPYVTQYLRKAAGAPVENTALAKLLSQLAGSLAPEQLMGLEKLLTPAQMEVIQKILAASPPDENDVDTKEPEGANG